MINKQHSVIIGLLIATPTFAQISLTKGMSQVTANGSYQYIVPIPVPTGRNGLAPNLSFIYDSNLGNGDLGLGWSLGGLSMITRCPRTLAQDGYVQGVKFLSTDAYCLDGRRLIPVKGTNGEPGTEYRTEIDAIDRIVSLGSYNTSAGNGGPTGFSVKTKSGLTIGYGGGVSNQADVLTMGDPTPGSNNPIRGWAVNTISDKYNNFINFYYTNQSVANQGKTTPVDDGVFYIKSISYNGAKASIIFNYAARSEPPMRYADGYALPHSDMRLNDLSLNTFDIDGNIINFGRYLIGPTEFSEHRDGLPIRMNSLSVCGMNDCDFNTEMKYESQALQPFVFSNPTVGFPGGRTDYSEYFVDLNGDGKKNWIRISQGVDEVWIGSATSSGNLSSERWLNISQAAVSANAYAHFFADVDGDGKADWIRVSRTTSDAWIALGNGAGSFKPWSKVSATVGPANTTKHFFADVNGDGRADWIQNGPLGANQSWVTSVAFATGGGNFQFWTTSESATSGYTYYLDLNGDGLADRVVMNSSSSADWFKTYFSQGDGTFKQVWASFGNTGSPDYQSSMGALVDTQFYDVNGDGNADLLQVFSGAVLIGYGKGNGRFDVPRYVGGAKTGGVNLFGDIDGDGMVDRVVADPGAPTGSTILVYPSTGSSNLSTFNRPISIPLNPSGAPAGNNKLYLADLNGDGKAELVMVSVATGKAWVAMSQAVFGGKMTSIGLQGLPQTQTQIQYKPISDNSIYTSDADATYPLRDAIFPQKYRQKMPVLVSSVISSNGIGGTLTTNYTYAGAKTDLRNRGFLGMRTRSATQVETGVTTTDTYRQDFPYTGLIASTKTTIAAGGNNGLLSQTDFTYGCTNFVDGGCAVAAGSRYFPYAVTTTTTKWDLNGSAFPSMTTSYVYDDFGNVTRLIKSTSDGFVEQTDTEYSNDTTKWWIGRPTKLTVTKTSP